MSRADVNGSPGLALYKDPASGSAHPPSRPGKDVSWLGPPARPSMRRVPQHILLVAWLLLVSQAQAFLGASPAANLDSNSERGLRLRLRLLLLGEDPAAWRPLPPPLPAPGSDVAALPPLVRFLHQTGPTWELRHRLADLGQRLKRNDPPLSIDLTFYLLRQMMEISRAQSQQAQAEQNRLLFDSVGK